MHPAPSQLKPAAAASLAKWHSMVAAGNLQDLPSIVHPDAVFRSPIAIFQSVVELVLYSGR